VDKHGNAGDGEEGDEDDGVHICASNRTRRNPTTNSTTPNVIALVRAIVRVIRASGLRRDAFNEVIKNGNERGWFKVDDRVVKLDQLQLLRDVETRWDSVFHMLARLRDLRPV
jgi:hypothetical protein